MLKYYLVFFDEKQQVPLLCGIIRNTNTISKHYEKDLIRPGHADFLQVL